MKTGRPLKFKTAIELEKQIDKYFEKCVDEILRDEEGRPLVNKSGIVAVISHPPTVAGLALWLGFEDRRSMYDYKDRPEFSHTIKKAILRIEENAENALISGKASTGAIFWLKNHGWTDKTVQDVNLKEYSLFEKETEEKARKYVAKHTKRNTT